MSNNIIEIARISQMTFCSLTRIFHQVQRYEPTYFLIKDSVLYAKSGQGYALLMVELSGLFQNDSNNIDEASLAGTGGLCMSFVPDHEKIRALESLKGSDDIRIFFDLFSGFYRVEGPSTSVYLHAKFDDHFRTHEPTPLGFKEFGVPQDKHNHSTLKTYLGKSSSDVTLLVFGEQLEQISVHGREKYTFTPGMKSELEGVTPDLKLKSEVAFKHLGDNHRIQLLKNHSGDYILQTAWKIDMSTSLNVYEKLRLL